MCPQRTDLLLVSLLGLLVLISTGLTGCATPGREGSPPTPAVATADQDLVARCAELDAENVELKRQMADLKQQHEELRRERDRLSELIKTRTGWTCGFPGPGSDLPAIEATVQKVERKQKYVMLSAGADDKVEKGYRFVISRKGRYIGDVQVDHVYPKASSASFVRVAPGFMIEVGDAARTRL